MTHGIDPLDLAKALIAAPSVTPATGAAFDVLEGALTSFGFAVERFIDGIEPDGPVENLLAVRRGKGPVHFGFAGHLDVVPPGVGWSGDAFVPEVRGELLYGRGAVDMKGAIAAFVAAAAATPAEAGTISLIITGDQVTDAQASYDENGRRSLVPTGEPDEIVECDDVLMAIGQENAFPWIEPDCGIEFDRWGLPKLDETTLQSTLPHVFFGGDAAFGPKNIIWAVAHGHDAAISIDLFLRGEDIAVRPAPNMSMSSQKMGIHEWSYDNEVSLANRFKVPWADANKALANIRVEVELGFDPQTAWHEAQRCLNCDVQTVFSAPACIECDACADICPTDCISFVPDGPEEELRTRLRAPALNTSQDLYVSVPLKTGRIMVKDEDVCLHCGLCAERCPTGAWDMRKTLIEMARAGAAPRVSVEAA